MPELPEVETIRRQLNESLKNRVIKGVEVLREKSFGGDPQKLNGWQVERVDRKAKIIEIYFKKQKELIIVHLKMTGQLVFADGEKRIVGGHPTADWVNALPSKHTRVVVDFEDGAKLFFNDMRVFGWMRLVDKEKYEKEMRKTAPDVTDREFSLKYLTDVLKKSGKAVKLVLMDQEKIGGVGNIYANDALYLAKVMPNRKANSMSEQEIKNLLAAIREVINKGIKYGGASAANYVDTRGLGGTYQDHFLVYKKDGQICKRCGGKIQKMKIGGRGTFYCPKCQK
jgi:formamidopyrimidine-DNA glycosylase